MKKPCAHCGLPAEVSASEEPAFCCPGCAEVFAILREAGLSRFYRLRDELGAEPEARVRSPEPREDYRCMDDPAFLAEHGIRPGHAELRLQGLHCAACVWIVERLPQAVPGVNGARVDFGSGRLTIDWDPERVSLGTVAQFLDRLGYPPRASLAAAEDADRAGRRAVLWRLGVTGALAGNVMLASFALYAGELSSMEPGFVRLFRWLALLFSIPAVTWGAWPFYRGAWSGLRMGVLHMDLPIALGIAAGFVASLVAMADPGGAIYFDTITILVFLLLVGRHLQHKGQQRVMSETEMLHALLPGTVLRFGGDAWTPTYVGRLQVGDRVRVPSGGLVPADGVVRGGASEIDASLLTGESRPHPVTVGAPVHAGTRNRSGELELEVTAVGRATRIGTIVAGLSTSDRPARIVRQADRLAGWFVATVLGAAVLGGGAWMAIDPTRVFDVVVSLLVVSCPCALGLATPMALAVARERAAREGILVRSTAALESLAKVDRVVFDKTGTLTTGSFRVTQCTVDREVLGWVVALERRATHPIARALVAWAHAEGVAADAPIDDWQEQPGQGVVGRIAGHEIRVGRSTTAAGRGMAEEAVRRGWTPVVIEVDGRAIGSIALGDRVRPEARTVVDRLRRLGKRITIASGDHPRVVEAVARQLGIESAAGHCSPEDKVRCVSAAGRTIMIGDGINDAPALRQAEVGVAVRGGAEASLRVADVFVGGEGLEGVAALFEGARRTLRVIRRNLVASLAYNAVFATLALAGHITPLMAAIVMPLSSLSVVASSSFARTFGPAQKLRRRERSLFSPQSLPMTKTAPEAM